MKNTGMIRKIDELGRIVIPKEIRKSLGIKDGENLEILIDNDNIYLKKASILLNFENIARTLVYFAYECMNIDVVICDRENVVASYNKDFLNRKIINNLSGLFDMRENYNSEIKVQSYSKETKYLFAEPILSAGDVLGIILLESDEKIGEFEKKFVTFINKILVNKIDII